ncbi:MAG: hypothetical protein HY529_03795 [Chloroflexi bacterium]|nr:hypothetical protein [Chloroflexota bacterium]
MKLKYASFAMLSLILLTAFPILGCSNQPTAKEQAAQQFFAAAADYLHEMNSLTTITESRLIEAESEMRAGGMDMKELGQRFHEIYFSEAAAIEFIDNLQEYSSLRAVMWEDGKPPKLIWAPDDYIYQNDFKQQHLLAYKKVYDYVDGLRQELGIDLQYRPAWYTGTPWTPREDSKLLKFWKEAQSIEETLKSLPDKPLNEIGK